MRIRPMIAGLALAALPLSAHAQTADKAAFRALYQEIIETNTTLSVGSCTELAKKIHVHLKAAGIPDKDMTLIVPPNDARWGNLVAVLHGSDARAKAVLMLAHLDVVEAKASDWGRDPFKLEEKDGYFTARGSTDDKAMASIFVDNLMRYKKEGYRPKHTIKLALTCGEETSPTFDGAEYLALNHHKLIEAGIALNEGGSGRSADGKYQFNGVEAGEKTYQDYKLETVNSGGHSSRPIKDNAIYQLAGALVKLQAYDFPIELNAATRTYFDRMSKIETGQLAADMKEILKPKPDPEAVKRMIGDPGRNGIMRTTCVATLIEGGHAKNALPQHTSANVNCRILPGHSQEEVRKQLQTIVADPGVKITFQDPPEKIGPPPPLTPAVMGPIEKLTAEMFPGVPVVPLMAAGATDGRFLTPTGIPTYGVSGIFADPEKTNAHGLNETVPVKSLYEGREFLYRLVKMYADAK